MNKLQQHDLAQLQSVDWLIGIDEAGRGCLAGPVTAGACVLARAFFESAQAVELSTAINDSKQLSASARADQLTVIEQLRDRGLLDFEVASGSVEEIAELNILGATRLAMRRAVDGLAARAKGWELPLLAADGPLFESAGGVRIIVDGRPLKPFPYTHTGIVKGDGKSLAIAMASIAAKVTRDREMLALAKQYPEYGFAQHKGYGTAAHRAALHAHGATPIHRELFLRKVLGTGS
ncbi:MULTISPECIES: ribonuclease HII [unclassified Lentimonas]|uniref:ribonuclease HII n=1 Tax=unclassified Lentimonas TaxID=2630993 RepID=UPI001320E65D|nr:MULTISPECIES: ribonuclease HII [unclassified Lentimonas]CAA6680101.1 Ribonuclease HII (EC [Lentimonas sp. CC4]CAA6685081.1 Ribonuclease HII (EC [Lentimonas sp. CC6]CAA6691445.1 Ribonuclease HII (EC [Lentimonas sp. CC10]CAA6693182.1 Ribonuclease HII (EC [Lentimonas sp. CC19]CAA7068936.1 Ribonuclease HII (EC [Lentimonas sp. CC11]